MVFFVCIIWPEQFTAPECILICIYKATGSRWKCFNYLFRWVPPWQRVLNCKMEKIKKLKLKLFFFNINYVMLCNVSCNFRYDVLVWSRYCTVDGDFFMSTVCQMCKKVYYQFIYCFWIMCIFHIVNVLITICMLFQESQWHLGKKNCHCFI